jgi:hypothetical protein
MAANGLMDAGGFDRGFDCFLQAGFIQMMTAGQAGAGVFR